MAGPRRRSAMTNPMIRARANRVFFLTAALSLVPAHLAAQTARAAAAYDYAGYWVSEVTEKWRYRMLVPDKGDYVQVPLNPEGRKVANAGIRRKIKRLAKHANRTVPPVCCKSPGGSTFIGRMTTRCAWIRIPGPRHASFISVGLRRRTKHPRGKDTRWRSGAEQNRETAVTAKADLCRIRRVGR